MTYCISKFGFLQKWKKICGFKKIFIFVNICPVNAPPAHFVLFSSNILKMRTSQCLQMADNMHFAWNVIWCEGAYISTLGASRRECGRQRVVDWQRLIILCSERVLQKQINRQKVQFDKKVKKSEIFFFVLKKVVFLRC